MDRAIKAGIFGFIFAVIINILLPDLYFLPQFVASMLAIYMFDLRTTNDGLLVAFMTYLFSIGILGSVSLAFYLGESLPVTVDLWLALNQIVTPLTALPAALAGVWLAKTRRPIARAPPPIPPV